jgi:hypothetical protein
LKKSNIYSGILSMIFIFNATSVLADNDLVDTSWMSPLASEFTKIDTSENGLILPNEAMKNGVFNKKTFAIADYNHDGSIDINEYIYYKTASWPDANDKVTIKNDTSDQVLGTGVSSEELEFH